MKPKVVLISLAISVGLALTAIVVLLPELRGSGIDTRPVFSLRVGDVSALELHEPTGESWELVREGSDWALSWEAGDGSTRRWPAEVGHVRGGIRLLIESVQRDSDAEAWATDRPGLVLRTSDGDWSIEFGEAMVGGQTPVEVVNPDGERIAGRIDTRVRELFTGDGLMAWRSTRAMAMLDRGVDRVYLASQKVGAIRLAKLGGRWALVEPISARGDDARCRELLGTLQRLTIESFHDQLTAMSETTGLAEPGAVISIERDVPGGDSVTRLTTISIGVPADLESSRLYVLLEQRETNADGTERVVLGPIVASVGVAQVNAISPFPQAYLSRRTLEATIPDIRRLEIVNSEGRARVFSRSIVGWSGKQDLAPSASVTEMLDELLEVLTTVPASQIELVRPEGWEDLGFVEVRDSTGASLGRVMLGGVEQDGAVVAIGTEMSGVVRLYGAERYLPLLGWIRAG